MKIQQKNKGRKGEGRGKSEERAGRVTLYKSFGFQNVKWLFEYAVFSGVLAILISLSYLRWMDVSEASTVFYVALTYFAHFLFLSFLVALPLFLISLFMPNLAFKVLTVLISTFCLLLLLVDTFVYAQFRFHISSLFLELTKNAGLDIFGITMYMWVTFAVISVVVLIICSVLGSGIHRLKLGKKFQVSVFALFFLSQIAYNFWHIWADAHFDSRMTSLTPHLPLFYPATGKRLLVRYGLVDHQSIRSDFESHPLVHMQNSKGLLYPNQNLSCEEISDKLNILIIVVDSLRFDMLDPRWMPNVFDFSTKSTTFGHHYSNGNVTKSGLFTLFYGVSAEYWEAFTSANLPPVVLSRMQELNYKTKVLASATLVSPAFNKNIFSRVEGLQLETPGSFAWQRDQKITTDWLEFTKNHASQSSREPFFGFLFYDSPHDPYLPKGYKRFEPIWENPNMFLLNNDFDPEPYFNLYKTIVHFTDDQIKRVLEDLKVRKLLNNTIVMITSDHGQEFNDNKMNYWGHGSNFSDYQLRVPMVVHWPGKNKGIVNYKTQHFDVAPTLMQNALGCQNSEPNTYSSGNDLFRGSDINWAIAHSYMGKGIRYGDLIISQTPLGRVEVTNEDLSPIKKYFFPSDILKIVFKESSRFYR